MFSAAKRWLAQDGLTSNLSLSTRDQAFAGDRVLHHAQVVQFQGDRYRLKDKHTPGITGPDRKDRKLP